VETEHNLTPDATFAPAHRLHSNRDYGRIFHRQQKAAGRFTVVLVMPRHRKQPQAARIGIMVGAKAVKTAVRRHQLKRWVRELFRTRLKTVLAGHDCIVLFRSDPPEDAHRRLDEEIAALVAKALIATATPGQRGGGRK
jgi:ribonuclease P protein component